MSLGSVDKIERSGWKSRGMERRRQRSQKEVMGAASWSEREFWCGQSG